MFDCVVAFGDSHVAGIEILTDYDQVYEPYISGQVCLDNIDDLSKNLSFPNKVAKYLGVPCYNYAIVGGSNDRSLRLLPQALLSHPNSLVLFGYTGLDRSEFFYPSNDILLGKDKNDFMQVGVNWYEDCKTIEKKDKRFSNAINDFYVEKILTANTFSNVKISNLLFYVELACKKYAIDYRHIILFDDMFKGKDCKDVLSRIDKEKILNFNNLDENNNTYLSFCREKFSAKKYGHYGEEAHAATAELIIKSLKLQ